MKLGQAHSVPYVLPLIFQAVLHALMSAFEVPPCYSGLISASAISALKISEMLTSQRAFDAAAASAWLAKVHYLRLSGVTASVLSFSSSSVHLPLS